MLKPILNLLPSASKSTPPKTNGRTQKWNGALEDDVTSERGEFQVFILDSLCGVAPFSQPPFQFFLTSQFFDYFLLRRRTPCVNPECCGLGVGKMFVKNCIFPQFSRCKFLKNLRNHPDLVPVHMVNSGSRHGS